MAPTPSPSDAPPTPRREPITKQVVALALTVAGFAGFGWSLWRGLAHPNRNPARTRIDNVALASEVGVSCGDHEHLAIHVVHSPDKGEWLQRGAEAFMSRCPNTQVVLEPLPDLEAVARLAHDARTPTLWMPTADVSVALLPERPYLERGPSLLRSPLVVLLWSDRLAALDHLVPAAFERPDVWSRLACALPETEAEVPLARAAMRPWTWWEWWKHALAEPPRLPPGEPTPAQLQQWDRVDFVHPSPTQSVTGLAALMLMAHGWLGDDAFEAGALEEELDAGAPRLELWLARCEAGQDEPLVSERRLAQQLHRFGTNGIDGVLVFERAALEVLGQLDESGDRADVLRVVTPATTIVADHPAVYLVSEDEPAGASARRLVEFLRSPALQASAIPLGFRPGDPSLDVRHAAVAKNPFVELRRFGVTADLDVRSPPPLDRERLTTLLETWQDASGRR